MFDDEYFMEKALKVAMKSGDDLPIGAVIVKDDKIITQAHNQKEFFHNSAAHAEMIAIRKAQKKLNDWRLNDCTLYVTLEPCPMCAWNCIQSGLKRVCFGSQNNLYGALGTVLDLRVCANSKLIVKGGVLEEECTELLRNYMKNLRKTND